MTDDRRLIEVQIHLLDDPSEIETLDHMFGEGQWVVCIACPEGPKWCAFHHKNYH